MAKNVMLRMDMDGRTLRTYRQRDMSVEILLDYYNWPTDQLYLEYVQNDQQYLR